MKSKFVKINNFKIDLFDLEYNDNYYIVQNIGEALHSSPPNIGVLQIGSALMSIVNMLAYKPLNPRQSEQWIRTCCPYTFEKIYKDKIPTDLILPLNRKYKPLGIHIESPWVSYEDFEFQSITPDLINLESCPKVTKSGVTMNTFDFYTDYTNYYYLYDDGCSPWYSKKHLIEYQLNLFKLLKFELTDKY